MIDAANNVPAGCIKLSVAFKAFITLAVPSIQELRAAALADMKAAETGRPATTWPDNAMAQLDDRIREAEDTFRAALVRQHLQARIVGAHGQQVELDPEAWAVPLGSTAGVAFTSDFVGPSSRGPELGGPDTRVGGVRQPVFFERAAFDGWLSVQSVSVSQSQGPVSVAEQRHQLTSPAPPKNYSQATLQRAMKERVKSWLPDNPPPSEAQDVAHLQRLFLGLKPTPARDARRAVAPPDWRTKGPRGPRAKSAK